MNAAIAKLKSFGDRPLHQTVFYVLFTTIPLFYLLEKLVCSVYDSDMYFLIATGREILENGIPYQNVWTIDSSSAIVIQQWLYDVVLALVDKAGYAGFSLFIAAEFGVFAWLWMKFFSLRHIKKGMSFFILVMVSMAAQDYLFSIRPQIITMILILATCVAIEKFMLTRKYRYLVLLPVMTCLEMQVHGSMWALHFAVVLAYMVPAFYVKFFGMRVTDDSVCRKKTYKPLLVSVAAMFGSLFLNPYGAEGVLYIVNSFKANTFRYVDVMEVGSTTFLSPQGATIFLCAVLFILALKAKCLKSVTVNMTAGFLLLMMSAIRNNTVCIFVFAFLMRDLAGFIQSNQDRIDWKKDMKLNLLPVLLFADLIFVTNFMFSCSSMFLSTTGSESNLPAIASEIRADYEPDMHIFTGFNCGAYFEYEGFRNLYIDARPELYTDEFTKDKNILADYSKYCIYGYDTDDMTSSMVSGSTVRRGTPVSLSEMQSWLTTYDFTYIVVSPLSEPFLSAYLLNCEEYEIVPEVSDSYYALYKKGDL